jgi:hypothetical protein
MIYAVHNNNNNNNNNNKAARLRQVQQVCSVCCPTRAQTPRMQIWPFKVTKGWYSPDKQINWYRLPFTYARSNTFLVDRFSQHISKQDQILLHSLQVLFRCITLSAGRFFFFVTFTFSRRPLQHYFYSRLPCPFQKRLKVITSPKVITEVRHMSLHLKTCKQA